MSDEPRPAPQQLPADGPADEALVDRIRSGDVAAFESLFRTHYDPLVNLALRFVRSTEIAEELVQDLFCRLWQQRGQWVVRSTLRGYLFTLIRNASLNYLRHSRMVMRHTDADDRSRDGGPVYGMSEAAAASADTYTLRNEFAHVFERAIEGLPPRVEQAYRLRRGSQLSYVEIAEIMGITPKSVERLLGRAHTALREALRTLR